MRWITGVFLPGGRSSGATPAQRGYEGHVGDVTLGRPTGREVAHAVTARNRGLPRARDRRLARAVYALRPQALRPAERRELLPFPHTQLHAEPARLAQAGLLEETREETGRRRRHYTITTAGSRRLAEWLSDPVRSPTEYRDLGLLKFFFSELAQPGDVFALAHEQASAQRAQQAHYESIIARFGDRPDLGASRVRTAELGVRLAPDRRGVLEETIESETQAYAA